MPRAFTIRKRDGFTLIELIAVVMILGIIGIIALAALADVRRDARIAAVQHMRGVLEVGANNARAVCAIVSACSVPASGVGLDGWPSVFTHNNQPYFMVDGWPDAGQIPPLASGGIDSQVNYAGFIVDNSLAEFTTFSLAGANDPANCRAIYHQPTVVGELPQFSVITSGC